MRTQALIQWIDHTVGGRMAIPLATYSAPAKFQGWQAEAWSLNIDIMSSFDLGAQLFRAEIWFLADNAPVEVLKPGMQFAMYEGNKIVLIGKCI